MVWDVFCRGNSDTIFGIRFDKIALINLLEGSSFGLIKVIGPTDQDHRPAVDISIKNTTDGIGMSRARNTETNTWFSSDISSVASRVCSLLLVSESIVIDSSALNGKP